MTDTLIHGLYREGEKIADTKAPHDVPIAQRWEQRKFSAALVNLLENAVDACRADGSKKEHCVRVSVKGLSDAVEVRIEDNGIGMTEETRTKLVTRFFSSKGKGGTGIGLYVARQVVMQHGGRIEVASVKGEGSTFTVTMPRILAK